MWRARKMEDRKDGKGDGRGGFAQPDFVLEVDLII